MAVILGVALQSLVVALFATHHLASANVGLWVGLGVFAVAISIGGIIGGEGRPLAGAILGSGAAIVTALLALFGG